jgi:CBS domain-containing protein
MKEVEELLVGDAMTRGVICVDGQDTVMEAAEVMKKNDISGVIVTKKGDGVGIVTERDIIKKVVTEDKSPLKVSCASIMTSPLITIAPDATIEDAARLMRDRDVRRLVVSEKNRIVGVISEFDIVRIEPALHTIMKEKYMWDISKCEAMVEGKIMGLDDDCGDYCVADNDDDEVGFQG